MFSPVGLKNIGNSCFLGAIFRVLNNLSLTQKYSNDCGGSLLGTDPLHCTLQKICSKNGVVSPIEVYKNLATSGFVKVVYELCDADECLDKLHDICELRYHSVSVNTNVWVGGFRVAATKGLSVCSFFWVAILQNTTCHCIDAVFKKQHCMGCR